MPVAAVATVSLLASAVSAAFATDGGCAAAGQARSLADIVLAMEGDRDYGEYLSGECVTCHRQSGAAGGIPPIVGLSKECFVQALFEYKINVRSNEVMKLRVVNLANEEIAALAAYFESLEPK